MLTNMVVMNAQLMPTAQGSSINGSCAAFNSTSVLPGLGQLSFLLWGLGGTCRTAAQFALKRLTILLPSPEYRVMKELLLQGTTQCTISQQVSKALV
jgi:hypothetical protein